jgi:hypothetical protein
MDYNTLEVDMDRIKGTKDYTDNGLNMDMISSLILKRRLQILVHSCVYYYFDTNIIDDETWNRWANELVKLQEDNHELASTIDYSETFNCFTGCSGFDLDYRRPEIVSKAIQIIKYNKKGAQHG